MANLLYFEVTIHFDHNMYRILKLYKNQVIYQKHLYII